MTNTTSFEPTSDIASDWSRAFAERRANALAAAFADDVVLEAAILNRPIFGREDVQHVTEAASKIHEHLVFTAKAADDIGNMSTSNCAATVPRPGKR